MYEISEFLGHPRALKKKFIEEYKKIVSNFFIHTSEAKLQSHFASLKVQLASCDRPSASHALMISGVNLIVGNLIFALFT